MANNKVPLKYFFSSTEKECITCRQIKSHSDFHKDIRNTQYGGLCYKCKDCANKWTRDWHAKNKNNPHVIYNRRNNYFKMTHGISLEERNILLHNQNYTCLICNSILDDTPNTHIDHDHNSNKIRGILCTNCNRGLGHFQDSISILENAILYLKNHTDNDESGRRENIND